jgi:hypothetical protein
MMTHGVEEEFADDVGRRLQVTLLRDGVSQLFLRPSRHVCAAPMTRQISVPCGADGRLRGWNSGKREKR